VISDWPKENAGRKTASKTGKPSRLRLTGAVNRGLPLWRGKSGEDSVLIRPWRCCRRAPANVESKTGRASVLLPGLLFFDKVKVPGVSRH